MVELGNVTGIRQPLMDPFMVTDTKVDTLETKSAGVGEVIKSKSGEGMEQTFYTRLFWLDAKYRLFLRDQGKFFDQF